jgi:hypothetical protein
MFVVLKPVFNVLTAYHLQMFLHWLKTICTLCYVSLLTLWNNVLETAARDTPMAFPNLFSILSRSIPPQFRSPQITSHNNCSKAPAKTSCIFSKLLLSKVKRSGTANQHVAARQIFLLSVREGPLLMAQDTTMATTMYPVPGFLGQLFKTLTWIRS